MKRVVASLLLAPWMAQGSELTFEFTNPSFGGNPLNGTFLLNSAQAQSDFKEPGVEFDPLASFQQNLERQVLNAMARKIVNDIYSEEGLGDGGLYSTDNYQIEVVTTNPDSVVVNVTDLRTGQVTVIEIPYL